MVEVEKLSKYFNSLPAIQDVSFKVEKGEIVALLGPNGAGKTTLMRILAGVFPPSQGTARVAGYDILKNSLEARRSIGYFPERAPLYPDMSVYSYLNFVGGVRGLEKEKTKKRIDEVIETCGIEEVVHKLIGNLSKGYRQRVCLAQTLIHDPDLLLLDEPTIGLDIEQVREVRKLIQELRNKKTILVSTHIISEADILCNRVMIINHGKLIVQDTLENLKAIYSQDLSLEDILWKLIAPERVKVQ